MQLRYAFRLDPSPGQRGALARAFGCARVVYNDAIAARERARAADRPFPTAGVLSRTLVTEAKKTPERHWLGEVSAMVLQQALRDVEAAY
ncbi:helix-turn-helix domain-containing protein, partial [Streptomyces sp. NPDC001812]|uniref:helix-turn-helix domain-containing protein n=1 Tax=Streptomyces sp. NPDC001812 TaxID=3364611 RepID=UPI0036A76B95